MFQMDLPWKETIRLWSLRNTLTGLRGQLQRSDLSEKEERFHLSLALMTLQELYHMEVEYLSDVQFPIWMGENSIAALIQRFEREFVNLHNGNTQPLTELQEYMHKQSEDIVPIGVAKIEEIRKDTKALISNIFKHSVSEKGTQVEYPHIHKSIRSSSGKQ